MNARAALLLCATQIAPAFLAAACVRSAEPVPAPHATPSAGWRDFERGRIRFAGPPDLVDQEVQGIDSLVGSYRSASLCVDFDFGWYSDDSFAGHYDGSAMRSGTLEATTVDGRPARLATWVDANAPAGFAQFVSLYVPDVDRTAAAPGENKLAFTVAYRDPADAVLARRIVSSVSIAPPTR